MHDNNGVTIEYKGYNQQNIKQADINLLGYPIGLVTNKKQLLADLLEKSEHAVTSSYMKI